MEQESMGQEPYVVGDDAKPWPQTMDAHAWAKTWLVLTHEHPDVPTDKAAMIGWFANAIMAGYDEAQRRSDQRQRMTLSASEAIYAFAGWLTTREVPLTMSARHDAAPMVQVVREFCERYALSEPREGWAELLVPVGQPCAMCGGSGTIDRASPGVSEVDDCPDCGGLR